MEWITRDQSKGWTTGRRKNIRSCRFNHFCRLNFVAVNAFKRCQCYQITITNSLKLAEKRIPMRRDPDVPIFTGKGSSWDMARGHVQCAVINAFKYDRRNAHGRNVEFCNRTPRETRWFFKSVIERKHHESLHVA